jgi:hypothetical protein
VVVTAVVSTVGDVAAAAVAASWAAGTYQSSEGFLQKRKDLTQPRRKQVRSRRYADV